MAAGERRASVTYGDIPRLRPLDSYEFNEYPASTSLNDNVQMICSPLPIGGKGQWRSDS